MENTVSDTDALLWRVATLPEQTDLHYTHSELICFCREWICFYREWFAFAMSDLLLSWQLNAFRDRTCNTRAKGNHVKAVRECSRIFRYKRPTSRRVSGVFRDCNHRINIGRSRVSICHGCSVTCLNIDWTLEWRAGIWINLWTLD